MNIDSIPSEKFLMGSTVSFMGPTTPIIQTFSDGKEHLTFVFVDGLPVPWNIFIAFMCSRFSPAPVDHSKLQASFDEVSLGNLWNRIKLPNSKETIYDWSSIIQKIGVIFNEMKSEDNEEVIKNLKNFIKKLDMDYESSFEEPTLI